VTVDDRQEYVRIYHHDVEMWLSTHLSEVPERFRDLVRKFILYCRRTGVKDITIYTYLPKLRNFLTYLHEQGVEDICDIDEDLIYDFVKYLENERYY